MKTSTNGINWDDVLKSGPNIWVIGGLTEVRTPELRPKGYGGARHVIIWVNNLRQKE